MMMGVNLTFLMTPCQAALWSLLWAHHLYRSPGQVEEGFKDIAGLGTSGHLRKLHSRLKHGRWPSLESRCRTLLYYALLEKRNA
jgi:hypothetical protein